MNDPLKHHHAVIMAGGRGERFWPLSREKRPKQLLPLLGDRTLIEQTVDRLAGVVPLRNVWVITNRLQAPAIRRVLKRVPARQIIAEPEGRDSAGAVMLGAAFVGRRDPRAVIAFLPADQFVGDARGYRAALKTAFEAAAASGSVVTLGQKPATPHTGYGYIESGKTLRRRGAIALRAVRSFREKPTLASARKMMKAGNFFWNLGIFVWSVASIAGGFKKSPPHARLWPEAVRRPDRFLKRGFRKLPRISIDYAVMEKMKDLLVVTGRFGWDDIGSWNALFEHLVPDRAGNIARGPADLLDTADCLAFAQSARVALLGVKNLIVVQTPDAVLICDRAKGQEIKKLVGLLPKSLR